MKRSTKRNTLENANEKVITEKNIPSHQKEIIVKCNNHSQYSNTGVLLIISVCIVLAGINIYEIRKIDLKQKLTVVDNVPVIQNVTTIQMIDDKRPVYWIYGRSSDNGHLKHVHLVLERLGYRLGSNQSDWDLLWAHDYPFRVLYNQLYSLKTHQRVNHFPGCGYITNKVDLATSDIKYIPKAFKLPEDKNKLINYVKMNPDKMFVQKSNDHRGIKIESVDTLNLDLSGTFIQEYVDKPFLVDGYKFDIGVYTIITSVDPLRVYIYNGDVLFRYCPTKYYPFDANDIDKYVVGDDYLPTWEVPSLKKLYVDLGFSMRDSFDAYVRSQGKDPSIIWEQIEESIREICLKKESLINAVVQRFYSKRNFFEMVRFDFVIDEDLNVYVMEANMSPNLSSAHYPPNQLLYEQVIFNLMGLIGVANKVRKPSLAVRSLAEETMQTTNKNIVVNPLQCANDDCLGNCESLQCRLCLPCLSTDYKNILIRSYREFLNKGDCKRIFPPSMKQEILNESSIQSLSPNNQLMFRWFHGKCLKDINWC